MGSETGNIAVRSGGSAERRGGELQYAYMYSQDGTVNVSGISVVETLSCREAMKASSRSTKLFSTKSSQARVDDHSDEGLSQETESLEDNLKAKLGKQRKVLATTALALAGEF
ncbi:hypothetical protein FQN54_001182 [Arachnomyces sp. PD_36]|nr:hypothetical protein FQN54_001182 [Arachnomyces sp. PD_36]